MPCSIDGCDRQRRSRTWCGAHYARYRTYGDPLILALRPRTGERSCAKCLRTPDAVDFRKDKRAPDGLGAYCKECERSYNAEYVSKNREQLTVSNRERYYRNRTQVLDSQRRYRLDNIDRIREYDRSRSRGNPIKIERARQWLRDNPDRARELSQRWYLANRDRVVAASRSWRERNAERYRAKQRDAVHRRRARMRGQNGKIEFICRERVWLRDSGLCGLCAEPVDLKEMHLDHIKPIARGGHHHIDNVQPSHPTCNLRKGSREVPRWAFAKGALREHPHQQPTVSNGRSVSSATTLSLQSAA